MQNDNLKKIWDRLSLSEFSSASEKNNIIKSLEKLDIKLQWYKREAQIEAALDKVRIASMSMHNSDDLIGVANVLYTELKKLGIDQFSQCAFVIIDEEKKEQHMWSASVTDTKLQQYYVIPLLGDQALQDRYDAWKRRQPFFSQILKPKQLKAHMKVVLRDSQAITPRIKEAVADMPETTHLYFGIFSKGYLQVISAVPLDEEATHIFTRFAKVFEQTYTRFLDLKKAEAQASEAQIDAALERVRSRTMAMQKSDELRDVVGVVFSELKGLGLNIDASVINEFRDESDDFYMWMTTPWQTYDTQFHVPYFKNPIFDSLLDARKRGDTFFSGTFDYKTKNSFFKRVFETPLFLQIPKKRVNLVLNAPGYARSTVILKNTAIDISNYAGTPYTDQENKILSRFGQVFEQSYLRFKDLELAEEQVRETQIQLALERVRARTMAMQNSSELASTSIEMFKQMQTLGMRPWGCGFSIFEKDEKAVTQWMTAGDGSLTPFTTPLTEDPFFIRISEARQRGDELFVMESGGLELEETYQYMFSHPAAKKALGDVMAAGFEMPKFQISHCAFFSQGYLLFITYEPYPEAHEIFKRFAKVFEQTYTRFLDLQKAEAQAREARIEAALEAIRSRSLAMHKSDELSEVIAEVLRKFQELGITMESRVAVIIVFDNNRRDLNQWVASPNFSTAYASTPYTPHIILDDLWHARETRLDFYSKSYSTELKNKYFNYLFDHSTFRNFENIEETRQWILEKEFYILSLVFEKNSSIGIADYTGVSLSQEGIEILKRFAKVFEQAYTRFLDLQKAEAQAREAEIQLALERVRAATMAMHKSEELSEVVSLVYEQIKSLGFSDLGCSIIMCDDKARVMRYWYAEINLLHLPGYCNVPLTNKIVKKAWKLWQSGVPQFDISLLGKEKESYTSFMLNDTDYQHLLPEEVKEEWKKPKNLFLLYFTFKYGMLEFLDIKPLSSENYAVYERFAKVFEQTYTRFLDLQMAEAQVRESQIQLALERVRARTMAMHKSDELLETANLIFFQLKDLEVASESGLFGFGIIDGQSEQMTLWETTFGGTALTESLTFPLNTSPYSKELFQKWHSLPADKRKEHYLVNELGQEEMKEYMAFVASSESRKSSPVTRFVELIKTGEFDTIFNSWVYHNAFFANGILYYQDVRLLRDDKLKILQRFARVFEQSYTRFLDLQKAEAQAKEAQIEVALERVRSRSMAMHKSEELIELVTLLYDEMNPFGFASSGVELILMDEKNELQQFWLASTAEYKIIECFNIPTSIHPHFQKQWKAWKDQIPRLTLILEGQEKKAVDQLILTQTDFKNLSEDVKEFILNHGSLDVFSHAIMKYGILEAVDKSPLSEEKFVILERFAKVFEQTYTRFLDLQKAEVQAREAQIEVALERVRSRTMAMRRSGELADVATILFHQVKALGVPQWVCGFCIFEIDDKECTWYPGNPDGDILTPCKVPLMEHPVFIVMNESRKRGDELYVYELAGEIQADNYRYMLTLPGLKELLQNMLDSGLSLPEFQINHLANFSHGNLLFITYEHFPEMHDIFKRFTKVFEQTYTRFLDLQKAEAQTREAQIEAALERVRARALAMHESKDMADASGLLFKELRSFEIHPFTCGYEFIDQLAGVVNGWIVTPDGNIILDFFSYPLNGDSVGIRRYKSWKQKEVFLKDVVKGKANREHGEFMSKHFNESFRKDIVLKFPEEVVFYTFNFSYGWLIIVSTNELSNSNEQIITRFTKVFEQTYTRFLDLQKAEAQALRAEQDLVEIKAARKKAEETLKKLKATQSQLIQSEKMASLGELTAGIAHEIQNPLNFVNNFSEVSNELIDEMNEELEKGDLEEVKAISQTIKQNLDKITHHGKRADSIVKGMLEHSRTSSGEKVPTDINRVCDEYLRLAYHGIRAKDSSFNALMETDFDESIGKINVIPLDIGRVVLNLITNAFQACAERSRSVSSAEFLAKEGSASSDVHSRHVVRDVVNPTVWLATRKNKNTIEISIKDNGSGIPDDIKHKIFQPFFTTKPTGQGTGLGLSLAYDIVKAHGGELRVESIEGQGTEFKIQLPKS